jgi:hypothetical protein
MVIIIVIYVVVGEGENRDSTNKQTYKQASKLASEATHHV